MKRAAILVVAIAACAPRASVSPEPGPKLEARAAAIQDTAPKEALRMVPPEAYMRTYLTLFGGLAPPGGACDDVRPCEPARPLEVQRRARGADGAQLFDTWDDYFASLGFPDYRIDMPRGTQTNALMVATFERLGVALCDRAVEHDLKSKPAVPVAERVIFAFDAPAGDVDRAAFEPRFDVLHRTFLGYPARLAPAARAPRFYGLFDEIVKRHAAPGAPRSRFSPQESGWAAVCYGLVRHPEFHLY
jgi:hypothetical protein